MAGDAQTGLVVRSLDEPDERREPPQIRVDVVTIGDATIARASAEPGWRWSESVRPIAGTDSCEVAHTGYVVKGRLGIRMDDGTEAEVSAGQAFACGPGHDGWVIGDEPAEFLEFSSAAAQEYAAGASR